MHLARLNFSESCVFEAEVSQSLRLMNECSFQVCLRWHYFNLKAYNAVLDTLGERLRIKGEITGRNLFAGSFRGEVKILNYFEEFNLIDL